MAREPELVELIEDNKVKLRLTESDRGSLNNRAGYTGRATHARIHGPRGSFVTFFDNQHFKTDQNSVTIDKKVDQVIEVPIATNFVDAQTEAGDGLYRGETPQFNWLLAKAVKKNWFQENIPASILDLTVGAGKQAPDPRVKVVAVTAEHLGFTGKRSSNNYRVDNTSSVRFGV